MPGTICFFNKCKNNSIRNPDRYFVPFVKPHVNIQRCKEWINLCRRPAHPVEKINKNSYVCDEHFDLNEVLDSRVNKTLKPIPAYRLKKVDRNDVFPRANQENPDQIGTILFQVRMTQFS